MIVTLTPNPSIDRSVFVHDLARGEVIRALRDRREPSGKGVNVALALHAAGHGARAVLPVGGMGGEEIVEMLRATGLTHITVPIRANIRSNLSIVEPDGTVTKINELGPDLDNGESDALLDATFADLRDVSWVAGCGSCPAGEEGELYQELVRRGRQRGLKTAVDTSGAALVAVLASGPDLIKPNTDELTEAVGAPLHTLGDVLDACDELRARGAKAVLASLGAHGALLLDDEGPLYGHARVESVVSAVGAGDVLLAGFLSGADARGSGATREGCLATALAWASAATQYEGTLFRLPEVPHPVTIHTTIDRDLPVTGETSTPQPTGAQATPGRG